LVSKYIGRQSVDWTLKNITQGNQWIFFLPVQWIGLKQQAFGCQKRFLQIVLLNRLLRAPNRGSYSSLSMLT
jgi:hypothetical protein